MAGIDIQTMTDALPDSFKEKGVGKMKTIILSQAQKVKTQLQPELDKINSQLPTVNDVCLPTNKVQEILQTRNNLVQQLNSIQNVLDVAAISVNAASGFLEALILTTSVLRNTRTAVVAANSFTPVVPGAVISTIQSISEVVDKITFDNLGNSRLNPIQQNLNAISIPVALSSVALRNFVQSVNNVDIFLKRCSTDTLTELSPKTLSIVEAQNMIDNLASSSTSTYKGFTLDIEEKNYSPTVKQKRANAKNSQGIILISTPYSFTTDNQVLINELKIIIDRDNLKAY
jgi:hypothetical protein